MCISLQQNGKSVKLSEVVYRPSEGFQESNTWYVAEETISADSDTKLQNGPATIQCGERSFPITVSVLEFEVATNEEDEPEEGGSAYPIEIGYAEGAQKLAQALGLLDDRPPMR